MPVTQPYSREAMLESLLRENAGTFRFLLDKLPPEMTNERRMCELSIELVDMALTGKYRGDREDGRP